MTGNTPWSAPQAMEQCAKADAWPDALDPDKSETMEFKNSLAKLKQAGKLRRLGPTKGGRWEVTEPDTKGKT